MKAALNDCAACHEKCAACIVDANNNNKTSCTECYPGMKPVSGACECFAGTEWNAGKKACLPKTTGVTTPDKCGVYH
jgi:hypothetical protein